MAKRKGKKKGIEEVPALLEELASLIAQMEPGDPEIEKEITEKIDHLLGLELPKSRLQDFARMRKIMIQIEAGDLEYEKGYGKLVQCVESAQKKAGGVAPPAGLESHLDTDEMEYLEMLVGVFCELIRDMEGIDPHLFAYCKRSAKRLEDYRFMTPELVEHLSGIVLILDYLCDGKMEFEEGHRLMLDILVQIEQTLRALKESSIVFPRKKPAMQGLRSQYDEAYIEEQAALLERMEEDIIALERGDTGVYDRVTSYIDSLLEGFASMKATRIAAGLEKMRRALRHSQGSEISSETVDELLAFKDALMEYFARCEDDGSNADDDDGLNAVLDALLFTLEAEGEVGVGIAPGREERIGSRMIPPDVDAEELGDFLLESPEFIQSAESALLHLENNPGSLEVLSEIFRSFHNIKGSASFLGLDVVVRLAHAAEGMLSEARDGMAVMSRSRISMLLGAVDVMRGLLESIKTSAPGLPYTVPPRYEDMVAQLELHAGIGEAIARGVPVKKHSSGEQPETAVGESGRKTATDHIKVNTGRLDNLIDAVGELVIAQAMVVQEMDGADNGHSRVSRNIAQLTKITREVQELAMTMRMVTLKNTFRKMERLARDLAAKSDALIDFSYSGEDTEIDRNMVDELAPPLVHMIRNAVDHGIEPPDVRASLGKPEKGRIRLSGYHEGGNVVISLEDDGRGLDTEALLERGISLGLIDKSARMGDEETQQLIFHDGISTARQVTDVSGRGVGMDVVKSAVDRLHGRIEVASVQGDGTRFTIRLPLTLAIIDGMVVRVADEHYVIPSVSILESIQIKKEQLTTIFETGEAVSVRGELIPLYRVHHLFEINGAAEDPNEAIAIILEENRSRFALLVDGIMGQQQVVIKPLGDYFSEMEEISGGAILGSGRVALILDPQGILEVAHAK
ncbi:MAG: chemotaxis protein CheW [Actinobacteria bacterium]|nr:chemotaxis protein CheW [Actinomycetota bacterium]